MNEPQSTEDTERLPDRPTATSHELRLLPDRGDFVGEPVPLPDRGDTAYEMVPRPHPANPPGLADDEIEPPIERHDPFAWMRNAPWMNRRLSPSGRAAILLRRDLEAFPVIEGRDPNHADLDAIVKRTVDYIVPIIRREQATDIVYEELGKRREERMAKARAASLALPAAGEVAGTLPVVGAAIARLAPVAAGVAGVAVGGFATLVVPTNFEGETFPLGDGLRARRRVGQRSIEIERQADNGLLDSGVGAKWEKLPVAAQFVPDAAGRDLLRIDAIQLERAVGKEAADRLLQQGGIAADGLTGAAKDIHDAIVRRRLDGMPAGPGGIEPPPGFLPIMEMRITSSVDGGETISHAEIRDEDAKNFCPNYLMVQEVGLKAGVKIDATGLPKGPERGKAIHKLSEEELKTAEIEKMLRDGGMQQLLVERIFPVDDDNPRYLRSGSSKIDVVERIGKDAVCVYDFKTGSATFPDHVRERYLREVAKHFKVSTVYVLPVYVP
ncbi:MAG: hypothetical protein Q8M19_21230 [Reyranella sp.]|nr:hypothetical protein [Reyranella sp.]